MTLYIWTDLVSFMGIAHASSVAEARQLLLDSGELSGDGSCPEREKARLVVMEQTPAIYVGRTAEFVLTDSAELREMEEYSRKQEKTIQELKAALEAKP